MSIEPAEISHAHVQQTQHTQNYKKRIYHTNNIRSTQEFPRLPKSVKNHKKPVKSKPKAN